MTTISKILNLMSGDYEFQFIYDETICGVITDFIVYDLGNLTQGFDNPDDDDLAIYPANIDITIDDDTRLNFKKFDLLKKAYSKFYPFNFEDVFYLKIFRNGELWFKGILENYSQTVSDFSVVLNFVDGINKLKDASLGNPYVLDFLYQNGLINRSNDDANPTLTSYAYGFGSISGAASPGFPVGSQDGVQVSGIEDGNADKNVNLKTVIEKLFQLLNANIDLEFLNQFYFSNAIGAIYEVGIQDVIIKRICSNLYGRFVVINKIFDKDKIIKHSNGNDYSDPKYFINVYEDEDWITFYHNWEGNFPENINIKVHHKGVNERKLNDFLKFLAKNLFSYFNFVGINKVVWKHKRFTSSPVILSRILEITADATVQGVNSVSVKGMNNKNEVSEGTIFEAQASKSIELNIPFTTEKTTNNYESWLYFIVDGQEKQVVNVRDAETNFDTAFIQNIIAKNEYELKKDDRLKPVILVEGVDYNFTDTFFAKHENEEYIVRPIMMEKNLKMDTTKITGVEIGI